ncbi:hypothetical protein [Frankia sp. AvcI1]|uniref:hypothetical protein n=1 Tax=Frankia sp. AvcI1 TaxID=573496 RepID=UPI0012FD761A|nr:hypothetical protein [Frankia sp. AvcI1]
MAVASVLDPAVPFLPLLTPVGGAAPDRVVASAAATTPESGPVSSSGVLVLLLAAQTAVPVALMVMFVAGVVISPVDLQYMLVLQERVPERLFGRVTSIATTEVSGPSPFGVSLLTWLIAAFGSRSAFAVLGCC